MSEPYLYSVTNNVATFSINDAPWNLMSLEYIDRLEELELRTTASSRVIAQSASAVAFLQGVYGYREIGGERIFFGTDSPLYSTAMQRARIDSADVSLADRLTARVTGPGDAPRR